ncbi:hypothetical protein GPECTOR_2g1545 [Gonium pectorale]|uniref:Cysteine protease n=1 Tax=Gonium pectorale TaxID=33097 RepID=A0A150H1V4_GONPE|nr:hypothetical protein GPECTOR_2g1545 [Gonium pectorale]|eukprot:KXZ55993.1 hypothetical protein GPECTOR_2g1545 [Gonium pectorale]
MSQALSLRKLADMMQALIRIAVGRCWSRQPGSVSAVQPVVELFLDHPDAPLSIHSICSAGVSAGIVAGRWVGPWMLCKGLEALFARLGQQRPMGLRLHVACGAGGGAPELDVSSLRAQAAAAAGPEAGRGPAPMVNDHERATANGDAGESVAGAACTPGTSGRQAEEGGGQQAALRGAVEEPSTSGRPSAFAPLLLLVPLTLGMDKVNPLYVPQLQQVLSWPQSVGIVGGRPSASLFLCGVQDSSFLYLDPHEAQLAVRPPAGTPAPDAAAADAAAPGQSTAAPASATALPPQAAGTAGSQLQATALASYFCEVVRLLPAASLDPSMAIGFLVTGPDDLEDLLLRLGELARSHSAAPLMTLASGDVAAARGADARLDDDFEEPDSVVAGGQAHKQQLEEWELL